MKIEMDHFQVTRHTAKSARMGEIYLTPIGNPIMKVSRPYQPEDRHFRKYYLFVFLDSGSYYLADEHEAFIHVPNAKLVYSDPRSASHD